MADDRDDELEQLRARVAELEARNLELQARANEVVARAQERTYWLDRWHLDLNELMSRPAAGRVRSVARTLRRWFYWGPVRTLRRLTGR